MSFCFSKELLMVEMWMNWFKRYQWSLIDTTSQTLYAISHSCTLWACLMNQSCAVFVHLSRREEDTQTCMKRFLSTLQSVWTFYAKCAVTVWPHSCIKKANTLVNFWRKVAGAMDLTAHQSSEMCLKKFKWNWLEIACWSCGWKTFIISAVFVQKSVFSAQVNCVLRRLENRRRDDHYHGHNTPSESG